MAEVQGRNLGFRTTEDAFANQSKLTLLADMQFVTHGHYINTLVVILSRRIDKRGMSKHDYYVQDASSVMSDNQGVKTRRRTVLSVWRDQAKFKPSPGDVYVILGAGVNKSYADDEVGGVLFRKAGGDLHGHLNIYAKNPTNWWVQDPTDQKSIELKQWYREARMEEARQREQALEQQREKTRQALEQQREKTRQALEQQREKTRQALEQQQREKTRQALEQQQREKTKQALEEQQREKSKQELDQMRRKNNQAFVPERGESSRAAGRRGANDSKKQYHKPTVEEEGEEGGEREAPRQRPAAEKKTKAQREEENMRRDTERLARQGKIWGNGWWLIDGWY